MAKADIVALKREVGDVQRLNPQLSPDNAFVLWFLRAFLVDNEAGAKRAIVGGTNDKGVDAIHVDHENRRVFVVQGKFRTTEKAPTEAPPDVLSFAGLSSALLRPQRAVEEYFSEADALVRDRALEAAGFLARRRYSLALYFVTTGRVTEKLDRSARQTVVASSEDATWSTFARDRVLALLQDYLEGAAPPVPQLDLFIDPGADIRGSGIIRRFDPDGRIESWVFPMVTSDVGGLYRQAKDRLFARNIRGFLDRTGVNESMARTLTTQPGNFWYFNNGVTIVCDSAEKSERHGREVLRVMNPQVINGQQTTRVLAGRGTRRASVLVRVIAIPRSRDGGADNFDRLVSQIVEATNFQNAIKPSDLRANDHEQVRIDREFRRLGFQYLRKRESKGEIRRRYGVKARYQIKKEELARVVAACETDPAIVLRGREVLFGDAHYRRVFSGRPAKEYLALVWLGRAVSSGTRGSRERKLGRWLILNFARKALESLFSRNDSREQFLRTWLHRNEEWRIRSLDKYIGLVSQATVAYYRKHRGEGEGRSDVVPFFKRVGHEDEFARFWKGGANKFRARAETALRRFGDELFAESD